MMSGKGLFLLHPRIPVSDKFVDSVRGHQGRFEEKLEAQHEWLQQIVETAREKFERPDNVIFPPKTPQKKGKRNQRKKLESANSSTSSYVGPQRTTRAAAARKLEVSQILDEEETRKKHRSSRLEKPSVAFANKAIKTEHLEASTATEPTEPEAPSRKRIGSDQDVFVDAVQSPSTSIRTNPHAESSSMVEEAGSSNHGNDDYFSPAKDPVADVSKQAEKKQRVSGLNRESRNIHKKSTASSRRSSVVVQSKLQRALMLTDPSTIKDGKIDVHCDDDTVEPSPQETTKKTRTKTRTKRSKLDQAEHRAKPVPPVNILASPNADNDVLQTPEKENKSGYDGEATKITGEPRKVTRTRSKKHLATTSGTSATASPNVANEVLQTPEKVNKTGQDGDATKSTAEPRRVTRSRLRKHLANTSGKSAPKSEALRTVYTPSASPSKQNVGVSGKALVRTPGNASAAISSFIRRNSPQKMTQREQEEMSREKLRQAQEKEREAKIKKDEILKMRIQKSKKVREERAMRVAEAKRLQEQKVEEQRQKLQEKHTSQKKLRDIDSEMNKKKQNRAETRRKVEQEELRIRKEAQEREEERVREQKERERKERDQKRREREMEEQQRLREREAKREEMIRLQKEEERQMILQKQRDEKQNSEMDKELKSAIKKHNLSSKPAVIEKAKPGSRGTFNVSAANQSMNTSQSYDITPLREPKPSSETNYNIEDLNSGDETDDEENPRKKIPFWAQGAQLKAALIQQFYSPPDTEILFGIIYAPELAAMFRQQRKRFHKRTSSAIWDSPLLKRPALAQ